MIFYTACIMFILGTIDSRQAKGNDMQVKLQGIGAVTAKPAADFRAGDIMVWNFGCESEVIEIVKETAKFVTVALRGETYERIERRLLKSRLVATA